MAASANSTNKDRYHHGDLRAALLISAEQELEESGIEAFSLRKVAKRAGVSHAAPTHHFRDVSHLLTALAIVGNQRFLSHMIEAEANAIDAADAVLCAGVGYANFAMNHKALFRLIFASDRPNQDDLELKKVGSAAFKHLADHVETLNGIHPYDDAKSMRDAAAIWAAAHGIADLLSSGKLSSLQGMDSANRVASIKDMLRRSLPSAAKT